MLEYLSEIIDQDNYDRILAEIHSQAISLFALGESFFRFAFRLHPSNWRNRISRCYYAAYNVKRAVDLIQNGKYSTDSSDHQNITDLPDDFPSRDMYSIKLQDLRNDRNLADYDHTARARDLIISQREAFSVVESFIKDAKFYLTERDVNL